MIASFPHTHTTGIKLSTAIVRNGAEIGYIMNNEHYDFNYQVAIYIYI